MVAALRPKRAVLWLGVHCNHPRELAPATRAALSRLARDGKFEAKRAQKAMEELGVNPEKIDPVRA